MALSLSLFLSSSLSLSLSTIALWDKTRSFEDIKNSLSHERGSERTDERVAQYLYRVYSHDRNHVVHNGRQKLNIKLISRFLFVPDHSASFPFPLLNVWPVRPCPFLPAEQRSNKNEMTNQVTALSLTLMTTSTTMINTNEGRRRRRKRRRR